MLSWAMLGRLERKLQHIYWGWRNRVWWWFAEEWTGSLMMGLRGRVQ